MFWMKEWISSSILKRVTVSLSKGIARSLSAYMRTRAPGSARLTVRMSPSLSVNPFTEGPSRLISVSASQV
ncbi:hypothetical protein D3C73_1447580 [compost metagenome]